MFWQGLILWYDNYGLWPWQAKPRPKTDPTPSKKKGDKKNTTMKIKSYKNIDLIATTEVGRYNKIERNERKCRLCSLDDVEDEYHFILVCPRFNDLRQIYIRRYYHRRPSVYKLIELFQSHNLNCLCNLAKYLIQSTQVRDKLI